MSGFVRCRVGGERFVRLSALAVCFTGLTSRGHDDDDDDYDHNDDDHDDDDDDDYHDNDYYQDDYYHADGVV